MKIKFLTLLACCLLLWIANVFAQEEEKPEKEIPKPTTSSLDEAISNYQGALEAKEKDKLLSAGDELAIWCMQEDLKDSDKKRIVATVERGFYERDDPEDEIKVTSGLVLAKMDKKYATPVFLKVFKLKDVKKNLALKLQFIGAMGSMADPKAVNFFCSLLKDKDFEVIAKAAEALANYKEEPGELRKELVKELINALEGPVNQANDPRNTTAIRKVQIIQMPVMNALRDLTKENVGTIGEWRHWFNKNKKKKW